MAFHAPRDHLGSILVKHSIEGIFPIDDSILSTPLDLSTISEAIPALSVAKAELQAKIIKLGHDNSTDFQAWIASLRKIQEDTSKSRNIANKIIHLAEEDERFEEATQEKNMNLLFVQEELKYNTNLLSDLRQIRSCHHNVELTEKSVIDGEWAKSLLTLDSARKSYSNIKQNGSIKALQLLDLKIVTLQEQIEKGLLSLWAAFVVVEKETEKLKLEEVVDCLESFGYAVKISKKLCDDLDDLIIKPRTTREDEKYSIAVRNNSITLESVSDDEAESIFAEIESLVRFLILVLPASLKEPLSESLMLTLSIRVLTEFLDRAIPTSLDEVERFKKIIEEAKVFIKNMKSIHWTGLDEFERWVDNFPKIWLDKRRGYVLDQIRGQVLMGIGAPILVEKVKEPSKQHNENPGLDSKNEMVTQDWDAAWDGDEDISLETQDREYPDSKSLDDDLEDEVVDAWGWGEETIEDKSPEIREDKVENHASKLGPTSAASSLNNFQDDQKLRGNENYWISALPQVVLNTVIEIFEDFADLNLPTNIENPLAECASGLLNLSIQVLVIYRAASSACYANQTAGNMYCYNDCTWLAENIKAFVSTWKRWSGIPFSIRSADKIMEDVIKLEQFGKRAYKNELNSQKRIINDLLGDTQNIFQQENSPRNVVEKSIYSATHHIRQQAALWDNILPPSARNSATGSLINTIATKLISDVFDMPDIGVDEAEHIATTLSKVEELDDLFLVSEILDMPEIVPYESPIPQTSQFADQWMRMKFLSEVLQSNLKDIKFLWFESDLSLYFCADEIIELVRLSFQMNAGVRQLIKEIEDSPRPKDLDV
ncbi:zw10/centromere/kinetochore protein zw10 [Blumeria hordei DH14]|uniref:Zw10/centromere/kinetochore protein zw10 n=1 Tax=Blumeria graminis f. sp. hordei (strain DH14) TaxID=546991 RepID=N1JBZ6_BLUG1|nr:zw10/centromere/kinetochore protein zw10 [Blumeria hordei DH14]